MGDPHEISLPDHHRWLRVADAAWEDPLDPSFADQAGGRWNSPGDGPTLYLCESIGAARAQIVRLLAPTSIDPDDLALDAPFILVTADLPARQRVADASTDLGLRALGLPRTYPVRRSGRRVPWADCRRAARAVRRGGLRGVLARSGVRPGMAAAERELAWFPARGARARSVGKALAFRDWFPDLNQMT